MNSFPPKSGRWSAHFFYQDNRHTFFVEPALTETTIEQWEVWAIPAEPSDTEQDDQKVKETPIKPEVSEKEKDFFDKVAPTAVFHVETEKDWVTDPSTVVQYGEILIGQGGGLGSIDIAKIQSAGGYIPR